MSSIKNIRLIPLLLILFLTGYFRDFVFINLNEQIRVTYYKASESFVSPRLAGILGSFSYPQLYYGKWILTLLFTLIYLGLAVLLVRVFFPEKIYSRWTLACYAFIFVFSLLLYGIGALTGSVERWYTISRLFMGFAQSPVLVMVLLTLFYIIKKRDSFSERSQNN